MEARQSPELALLEQVAQKRLLAELVVQLNKDAHLSGTDLSLHETATPQEIVQGLYTFLQRLVRSDHDAYLNLLYRVDIPESRAAWTSNTDADDTLRDITLRILQREWQKVWFRNKSL